MINQQVLEGHWNELRGQLQEKWGQLTDDDLREAEGDVNQLIGVIQRKTGYGRERIETELEELLALSGSTVSAAAEKARQMTHQASERVQHGYEEVSHRVREGYSQAEATVQAKPLESIAVAFGSGLIAGVIVGLIFRSR